MKSKESYESKLERLQELVYSEHVCGCSESTCDINASYNHGYGLWSIYLFSSSGAASEEFTELLDSLPQKQFSAEAELERKEFVKEVSHAECSHCNAVSWDIESIEENGNVFCGSCGNNFPLKGKPNGN